MLADLLRIILAFFLPPMAVATQVGIQAGAFLAQSDLLVI